MSEIHFQDVKWQLSDVNLRCKALVGLTFSESPDRPDVLILRLENNKIFRLYLSAFIGFCSETSENEYEEIVKYDFQGAAHTDYLGKYQLDKEQLLNIKCDTGQEGIFIRMEYENKAVYLNVLDKSDCHSDSTIKCVELG